MADERPDFVNVRLTAKGEEIAKGQPVRFLGPGKGHDFTLPPGQTVEVTRSGDWESYLSKQHTDGEPLVELAE
jgi:hypothetical protein